MTAVSAPLFSLVRGQSAKMIVDGFAVDTRELATPTFPRCA